MTPTQVLRLASKNIPWPKGVAVPSVAHVVREDAGKWAAALDAHATPFIAHGKGTCPDEAVRNAAGAWLDLHARTSRKAVDEAAYDVARAEIVRLTTT